MLGLCFHWNLFFVCISSWSSGAASEEAGWKVFGKNCSALLFLLIKEICVLDVSVVPEDSKGVTCLVRGVPGMRNLGHLWFYYLEHWLHFYILEEWQLARVQQRLQCFSTVACPWFLHTIARQHRLSPVPIFLALLVMELWVGRGVAGLGQGVLWEPLSHRNLSPLTVPHEEKRAAACIYA